jgi:hypothetical protein
MYVFVMPLELPRGVNPDAFVPGLRVWPWLGRRPVGTLDLTDESSPGRKKESAILDFFSSSSSYSYSWTFLPNPNRSRSMMDLEGLRLRMGASAMLLLPISI